jgi:hypothetical protein
MARPTRRTTTVAHIGVGIAAALIVPKIIGKGSGTALVSAVIGVLAHAMLDAPVAQVMANNGIQL